MRFADRLGNLGSEQAFGVLARAKEMERRGIDMVHMEIGDTDFSTPYPIVRSCIRAIKEGKTHYLPSQGLLELRRAAAAYVSETRHIDASPEETVIVPGGKPIIFNTILATVNPGDEVIIPDPGYPAYESVVHFAGAKPVYLPIRSECGFAFDIEEFRSLLTRRTKLIILNSPHNPTGGMLAHEHLEAVAAAARDMDLWVMSDEVYDRLIYEGEFESVASLPGMKERTVIMNAFTKTFSMSGWRLGYAVMPEALAHYFSLITNNSVSCTCSFVQWAGIEGFSMPERNMAKVRNMLKSRRDLLVKEIRKLPGVQCHIPKATIYIFADIRGTGHTSAEVYEFLFSEAHIATLAGTAFGANGEGFIRLSFGALSLERIKEAMNRIKKVWHRIAK
jgi:aspartate aminotransferase